VDEKVIHRVLEEETMSFHPLEGVGRERVGAPDLLTPCPMGHRSTTLDPLNEALGQATYRLLQTFLQET
jgi:hypothetical protein